MIKASAAKLAIRWKSIPMGRKQVSDSLPCPGYEPSALNYPIRASHCDGLSQHRRTAISCRLSR